MASGEGAGVALSGTQEIVLLSMLCILVGSLVEALPEKVLKLFPQSVLVLILFGVFGLVGQVALKNSAHNNLVADITRKLETQPEGIQLVFLPPLIFSELFKTNVHIFFVVLVQIILLAFIGVLISTGIVALFPMYILEQQWSWYEALAFGGMLSATDPVAVIAVLEKLGASKRLSTIVSGESVFNDGTAIIISVLFLDLQRGISFTPGEIVAFIFQEIFGSLALGTAFGLFMMLLLPLLSRSTTPLVALTFALPYLSFLTAMQLDMSGVLSLVPLGLMTNAFGKAYLTGEVAERMEHFWNQAEFISNAILFGISGLFVANDLYNGNIAAVDWGFLLVLYIICAVARFVAMAILYYPGLAKTGYGMSIREAAIVWHGALRGAVGLTLALIIRGSPNVDATVGNQVTFYMAGMVVLTLLINATTCGHLLTRLGLRKTPDKKVMGEIENKFKELASQSLSFAGASANAVNDALQGPEKTVVGKKDLESAGTPHSTTKLDLHLTELENSTVKEKRRHFLLAQAVTYNRLLTRKLISRSAWFVLMQSIQIELDLRDTHLNQWHILVHKRRLGKSLLTLAKSRGTAEEKKLISILEQEDLSYQNGVPETATSFSRKASSSSSSPPAALTISGKVLRVWCFVAYGYLRAHQVSRAALITIQSGRDGLLSERNVVVEESLEACKAPAAFLNAVRALRPAILEDIKATQINSSIKHEMLDYTFELSDLGLIEENELEHLLELSERICAATRKVQLFLHSANIFIPEGNFEFNEDLYPFKTPESTKRASDCHREHAQSETQPSLQDEGAYISITNENDMETKQVVAAPEAVTEETILTSPVASDRSHQQLPFRLLDEIEPDDIDRRILAHRRGWGQN